MEMIQTGELEKNNATMKMGDEELHRKSINAIKDQHSDSLNVASTPNEEPENDTNSEKMRESSEAEPNDSFPWISGRYVDVAAARREDSDPESFDSFPWIGE